MKVVEGGCRSAGAPLFLSSPETRQTVLLINGEAGSTLFFCCSLLYLRSHESPGALIFDVGDGDSGGEGGDLLGQHTPSHWNCFLLNSVAWDGAEVGGGRRHRERTTQLRADRRGLPVLLTDAIVKRGGGGREERSRQPRDRGMIKTWGIF